MVSGNEIITTIVSEFLGVTLISYLWPMSITQLMNVSSTGWGSGIWGMWQVMPIFLVIAGMILIIAPIVYLVHESIGGVTRRR